ncbi:MAG: CapA family protein, partial [Actinobacteria bacterium]|nr:CapA family protein [Actinomycetota bacterium]
AWGEPDRVAQDPSAARSDADHVIVLLHSGWEKTETLSPEQQDLGQAALDAGARRSTGTTGTPGGLPSPAPTGPTWPSPPTSPCPEPTTCSQSSPRSRSSTVCSG